MTIVPVRLLVSRPSEIESVWVIMFPVGGQVLFSRSGWQCSQWMSPPAACEQRASAAQDFGCVSDSYSARITKICSVAAAAQGLRKTVAKENAKRIGGPELDVSSSVIPENCGQWVGGHRGLVFACEVKEIGFLIVHGMSDATCTIELESVISISMRSGHTAACSGASYPCHLSLS